MKPLTREWVEKAENDWGSLLREIRARKNPNYDAACFFAQQCCEKYIKARLIEADAYFKKVHDLAYLLGLAAEIESLKPPYMAHFLFMPQIYFSIRKYRIPTNS